MFRFADLFGPVLLVGVCPTQAFDEISLKKPDPLNA